MARSFYRLADACCIEDYLDVDGKATTFRKWRKAHFPHESPAKRWQFSIETPDASDYLDYHCDCVNRLYSADLKFSIVCLFLLFQNSVLCHSTTWCSLYSCALASYHIVFNDQSTRVHRRRCMQNAIRIKLTIYWRTLGSGY